MEDIEQGFEAVDMVAELEVYKRALKILSHAISQLEPFYDQLYIDSIAQARRDLAEGMSEGGTQKIAEALGEQ